MAPASTPAPTTSTSTHCCLICTVSIRETHLGINVCRACSLFFKRTRRSGRVYTCRRGTGKCVFRKHEPMPCKKCRFEKCLAIGMENQSEPGEESMLDRIKEEYELSFKRRVDQERRLAEIHNLPRVNTPQELYQTSAVFYYDTYPVTLKELIVLLNCIIPEFDEFTDDIKFSILKSLLGKFYAMESYFRTSRVYLKNGKCISTAVGCFDIKSNDQWISEEEVIANKATLKRSLKSSLQAHARDFLDVLYKMLRTDDITDREFHALIAITFCHLDTTIHLPDKIQCLFDGVRTTVLKELQQYYKERLRLVDYSTRLGNLMTLTAAISEIHIISLEQQRLYSTLFDIRCEDEMLREAIANCSDL